MDVRPKKIIFDFAYLDYGYRFSNYVFKKFISIIKLVNMTNAPSIL